MLRLSWTGVPSWWHCPQTNGTFIGATAERGSLTGTMSWFPWQFTQRGASASPRAIALPCMDFACCCPSSLWQEPQLTLLRGTEWGSSLPSRSAWQLVHDNEPCTEPPNFFWSTKSETVRAPRLVVMDFSPWHIRQSSLLTFCSDAGLGAAIEAVHSNAVIITVKTYRFTKIPLYVPTWPVLAGFFFPRLFKGLDVLDDRADLVVAQLAFERRHLALAIRDEGGHVGIRSLLYFRAAQRLEPHALAHSRTGAAVSAMAHGALCLVRGRAIRCKSRTRRRQTPN